MEEWVNLILNKYTSNISRQRIGSLFGNFPGVFQEYFPYHSTDSKVTIVYFDYWLYLDWKLQFRSVKFVYFMMTRMLCSLPMCVWSYVTFEQRLLAWLSNHCFYPAMYTEFTYKMYTVTLWQRSVRFVIAAISEKLDRIELTFI